MWMSFKILMYLKWKISHDFVKDKSTLLPIESVTQFLTRMSHAHVVWSCFIQIYWIFEATFCKFCALWDTTFQVILIFKYVQAASFLRKYCFRMIGLWIYQRLTPNFVAVNCAALCWCCIRSEPFGRTSIFCIQ